MDKITIYSPVLPPSGSGQALVLFNLLKKVDPQKLFLISGIDYSKYPVTNSISKKLDCDYEKISVSLFEWPLGRIKSLLLNFDQHFNFFFFLKFYLPLRSLRYSILIDKKRISQFVCCSGSLFEPYAIYLACKKRKIPYFFYAFDCFSLQWLEGNAKKFAEKIEPLIIRGSKGIFVPNELLGDYYKSLYNVDCIVIHNSLGIDDDTDEKISNDLPVKSEQKIVYTGSVYYVHIDSFKNLIEAITLIANNEIILHLYTAQSASDLIAKGISGPVSFNSEISYVEIKGVQKEADILFLPLGFESDNPDLIRLSSPGKMGEYLASGRPILVHAPADSFISQYFRKYDCGMVVSEPDINELAEGIKKILYDKKYSDKIIQNALIRAKIDFNIEKNSEQFIKILNL